MVCSELEFLRATLYSHCAIAAQQMELPLVAKKRGPKTKLSDEALTEAIRRVLARSPFTGEGHRKAWARLRSEGVRTSLRPVLRLMRDAGLLAPYRAQRTLGPREHNGTIVTSRPNEMSGTDATQAFTTERAWATVFIAVDHCTTECVGAHAAKHGTRYEALEPIRQGVKERFALTANRPQKASPCVTTTAANS